MAKTIVEGQNFFHLSKTGSFGVVNDVRYVRCYWPPLDEPTALFAEGSSGIEVQGPPTPRNVVFPADTVFLNTLVSDSLDHQKPSFRETSVPTRGDCFYVREERDVEHTEIVKRPVTVEVDGKIVEALADVPVPVLTTQKVVTLADIDRSNAEQIADVVKVRDDAVAEKAAEVIK